MTKDQIECLTLKSEMDEVKINDDDVEKQLSINVKKTSNGNNDSKSPTFDNVDSKLSPKSSIQDHSLISDNNQCLRINNEKEIKMIVDDDNDLKEKGNLREKLKKEMGNDDLKVGENVNLKEGKNDVKLEVKGMSDVKLEKGKNDVKLEEKGRNDANLKVVGEKNENLKEKEKEDEKMSENMESDLVIEESGKSAPIREGGEESAPIREECGEGAPIREKCGNSAPMREASGKCPPIREASGESAPIKEVSGKNAPIREESGKSAPIKEESGKSAPIREASGKNAPIREEGGKSAPIKEERGKSAPIREASGKSAPIREASGKNAPIKEESGKSAPIREASGKNAPIREESDESAPIGEKCEKSAPMEKELTKGGPIREQSMKNVPVTTNPMKNAPNNPPKPVTKPTIENVPIANDPKEKEPIKNEPPRNPPIRDEPEKSPPMRNELAKNPPIRNEPAKNPPIKNEPAKNPPIKIEPAKNPPIRNEPTKNPPIRNEPAKNPPIRNESAKNPPIRSDPTKNLPIKNDPKNPPIRNDPKNPTKNEPIKKIPIEQNPNNEKEKIEKNPPREKCEKLNIEKKEISQEKGKNEKKTGESEESDLMIIEECEVNAKGHGMKSELTEMTARRKVIGENFKVDESKFEVGIVGEPTAVTELINDDELGAESTLPTADHDHVAKWVENSSNVVDTQLSDGEIENLETTLMEMKVKRKRKESIELSSRKRRQFVKHIIKRSIKCLNKMHAMDENLSVAVNTKKMKDADKKEDEDFSRQSPQVPQSQQNGAALPEEAVIDNAERLHTSTVKEEPHQETISDLSKKSMTDLPLPKQNEDIKAIRTEERANRKRRSTDEMPSTNGNSSAKKICLEQREQLVSSLITGYENASSNELASRADVLRAELQALDELARATEMEWNRVLTMRKLKEEAYLRIERRRQVVNFMEGQDRLNDLLPTVNSALDTDWEGKKLSNVTIKEKCFPSRDDHADSIVQNMGLYKNVDKVSKSLQQTAQNLSNRLSADSRKQAEILGENRQIGEGRQGPIVDVRSIIADYRLRHPETVPRRGRRMRNSVNVNLGAGGAVMENNQNADSRPSSTDSCKSNPNVESNNSMSFKDVLVQFAKLSQQQGEPVKTPQNYPDVTLHPVAPSPTTTTTQSSTSQQSGSLLHGILTKAQSPRPTTFSPTLARLLTAPERERNAPVTTVTPHPNTATQRMIQAYQEANPVSISELLSSSKGRTEITITPVVNPPPQSHVNNMMQVDDEEETAIMEERESRISGNNRDDRDVSPRCQGCHERAAQYVCAGCGNQWYCSPECQAAAWDEHSEVCSG